MIIAIDLVLHTTAPRCCESNENILLAANGLVECPVGKHGDLAHDLARLGLDARLIGDELSQALDVSAPVIILGVFALAVEPLQCWEALDTKLASEIFVFIGVDLANHQLVFCELEALGELLVNGGKGFAVAAPRGEELDKRGLARLEDYIIEVAGDQIENGGAGAGTNHHEGGEDDCC
jgi:hypothetical protein